MRSELIHTSVPRGLDGGTGFAVAARTGGMPRSLADAIAALSGLPEAWQGATDWDRTMRSTRAVGAASGAVWVASVIRPCGLDHTGRGNRIAHHRVLDAAELQACDPSQLLGDHERWMAAWRDEPRELEMPAALPAMPASESPANAWRLAFGDAGMAAEMLERAFRSGIGAWVVVPAGADRLALLQDMVALLPSANRWKRGWSTRPLRPGADPVPVVCVIDEREPEVLRAPANAAWMLRPQAGAAPRASEALLRRAREGGRLAQPVAVSRAEAAPTVPWNPPARIETVAAAAAADIELPTQSDAPTPAPTIRVELAAPERHGWPTRSSALNALVWLAALGLVAAAARWLLAGRLP